MTNREKNLAILVAALVVGWAGWSGWTTHQAAYDQRASAVIDAQNALDKARDEERRVKEAALEKLASYQERSLPTNLQVAQQEYRAMLLGAMQEAGLEIDDVTNTERRPGGEAYTSLGYAAKAEGDLPAVTKFLYAFYDSPLLHKMTMLKLVPRDGGRLQINFNATALSVAGAEIEAGTPQGESGRPLLGGVDKYLASIPARDVFSRYVPPPPPRPPAQPVVRRDPPPPPKFDDAAHAVVTGIVQAGDRLQAWITVRTTGEVLRLSEGDELQVGQLEGKIESVSAKQIIVQTGGERYATPLGANLRDGVKLEGDAIF